MGQAIGVPVYYKHELFDEIIAFPPMPVALDFEAWMRLSGVLFVLERDAQPADILDDHPGDVETLESLVDRIDIDGQDYIELSPTGQIFHETFRERFRAHRDRMLPPPVPAAEKKTPHFEDSGTMDKIRGLKAFVQAVIDEVPQVAQCATFYSNPDLPRPSKFWVGSDGIVGQYGDGKGLVKFRVETREDERRDGRRGVGAQRVAGFTELSNAPRNEPLRWPGTGAPRRRSGPRARRSARLGLSPSATACPCPMHPAGSSREGVEEAGQRPKAQQPGQRDKAAGAAPAATVVLISGAHEDTEKHKEQEAAHGAPRFEDRVQFN